MAGAGKKTFTAGEVLTASDVNTYLMEQSVMYFAGTAARSSAIPTPSTGMTSYIGVTGTASIPQIETYTGSAWQTPYGATLVASRSFTSAASVAFDNVFSANYTNYEIFWNLLGASAGDVVFQWRLTGADVATSYASTGVVISTTTGAVSAYGANASTLSYLAQVGTARMSGSVKCFSPFVASVTHITTHHSHGTNGVHLGGSYNLNTGALDGFKISAGVNVTGEIQVYGYRKS